MASLSSGSESDLKRRKPLPIERRPLMLKDFLGDDLGSCSSNGFRSIPRRSCGTTVRNLLEMDLKAGDSNQRGRLVRSRSKAASTTISALQKASEAVINAVKYFPFSSVISRSPPQNRPKQGILPRSLSRRLSRRFWKKSDKLEREIRVTVRVKDIIRCKSFKDLAEEKQQMPDFSSPLHICTTTTATTTTTTSSNSNSWSESDFISEYLQSSSRSSEYSNENEAEEINKCSAEKSGVKAVGEDSIETTTNSADAKGVCPYEEKEQLSPVSVLDFPYEEEEEEEEDGEMESSSSFGQSLANMERTKQKLMQKIRSFERLAEMEPVDLEKRIASEPDDSEECPRDSCSISFHEDITLEEDEDQEEQEEDMEAEMQAEDGAMELLKLMKATSSLETRILLDFFRDGIIGRNQTSRPAVLPEGDGFEYELLKVARDWINGQNYESLEWGLEFCREAYVRDMESEGKWKRLEEEQGELALELEIGVMGSLVDELLLDLLS